MLKFRPHPLALALTGLLVAGSAQAAVKTWIGTSPYSDQWSDTANWQNGAIPVNGDAIVFSNSNYSFSQNNLSDLQINGISLTFNEPLALTVAGNGLTSMGAGISVDSQSTQHFTLPITLGADQTWNASCCGAALVVSGPVNLNGHNLTLSGGATLTGQAAELLSSGFSSGSLTLANGGVMETNGGLLGNLGNSSFMVSGVYQGTAATWTTTGDLIVGQTATGSLNIASGGIVNSQSSTVLGSEATGIGLVNISGSGSSLNTFGVVSVGDQGQGTLTVQSQGQLSLDGSSFFYVGNQTGSQGTVTVDGAGSGFSNTNSLNVGNYGSGSLNVQNGASISFNQVYLGYGDTAQGTATVTGAGSILASTGNLNVGLFGSSSLGIHNQGLVTDVDGIAGQSLGTTNTITVDTGGQWQNSNGLMLANSGDASLNIASGGQVSSQTSTLAYDGGTQAQVLVDGMGSNWTTTAELNLAVSGSANLTVQNGGSVSANQMDFALESGSQATVNVTGAGSSLSTTGDLTVGGLGAASVTLANGGMVNSGGALAVNAQSQMSITGGTLQAASLAVNGGGQVHLSGGTLQTDSIYLDAGSLFDWTSGTLKLSNLDLGASNTALGDTVVLQNGQILNATHFSVGNSQSANLTLQTGGTAITPNVFTIGSQGVVNLNGGTLQANTGTLAGGGQFNWTSGTLELTTLTLGNNGNLLGDHYQTQTGQTLSVINLGVGDSSSGSLTVQANTVLNVGNAVNVSGQGTLNLSGGTLQAVTASLATGGQFNWSAGTLDLQTATLGDSGSLLGNSLTLDNPSQILQTQTLGLGINATGTLTIQNGYNYDSNTVNVGQIAGQTGQATVSGNGSLWHNQNTLLIGGSGSGSVNVVAGGQLIASGAGLSVGASNGSVGILTVDGAGSTLQSTGFTVGGSGTGSFNLQNGATVTSTLGTVGNNNTGTATVTGSGSVWDAGSFTVGNNQTGTLNILAGAKVNQTGTSGYVTLGNEAHATGTVTVYGAGSELNLANTSSNTSPSGLIIGNLGNGTLNIENGGQVSSDYTWLGYASGSNGRVTVDGAGSTFDANTLTVGFDHGQANLTVQNGASMFSNVANISVLHGSGAVTVTGAGSQWTLQNQSSLSVGFLGGAGTLNVNAGGKIQTDGAITVNQTSSVNLNDGGKINIQTNQILLPPALTVSGNLNYSGSGNTLNAEFYNYGNVVGADANAQLVINGKVVEEGGHYSGGNLYFTADHHLDGSGQTQTESLAFGDANVEYGADSKLHLDFSSPTVYDQLTGLNLLDFQGKLALTFAFGFKAQAGDVLNLFDFQQFSGLLDSSNISVFGISKNALDFSYLSVDGTLHFTTTAESVDAPAPLWLLLPQLGRWFMFGKTGWRKPAGRKRQSQPKAG